MLDFSGPSIDSNIIEKFVCRITPVDNGHYRWDLNFAPNKKQAIIGVIEGRKGKASVEIKEYGEDDEHPHHTYDRSIQFSTDGTIAYFCLIAACVSLLVSREFFFANRIDRRLAAFSVNFALYRIVWIAVKPKIPFKPVF